MQNPRFITTVWFGALVLAVSLLPSAASDSLKGDWIGTLPGVGKIVLEFGDEYRGHKIGRLFWVFQQERIRWVTSDSHIRIYKYPGLLRIENDPVFILRHTQEGQLVFESGGLVTPSTLASLQPCAFERAARINFDDIADFRRKDNQYEKFSKQGELQPLPETFPKEFIDVSVLLFQNRNHELYALLKHPKISPEVLAVVAEKCLSATTNSEFGFLRPLVASHLNMPPSLLGRFLEASDDPCSWRAVALHPKAPAGAKELYLRKIKEGTERIRSLVARDRLAPREALEAAIAKKERYPLQELARNPSAPSDLLAKVATEGGWAAASSLGANPNAPSEALLKLAESTDKQVLWSLLRNPQAPSAAVEKALRTLAGSRSSNQRSSAAQDARLPAALFPKLASDSSIQVRLAMAKNRNASFALLAQLARDSNRWVSEHARANLSRRFPALAKGALAALPPLDRLNPAMSLEEEFIAAVRAGNVEDARRAIRSEDALEDIRWENAVAWILQVNFDRLAVLLREEIARRGGEATRDMVGSRHLRAVHVPWLKQEGLLAEPNGSEALLHAIKNRQSELVRALLEVGVSPNPKEPDRLTPLAAACASRDIACIRALLKAEADPAQVCEGGQTAADISAQTFFIAGLKLVDRSGKYRKMLIDFEREFPSTAQSSLLGAWSNKKDGFETVAFQLAEDGTGFMGASIAAMPIAWRHKSKDEIEIVPITERGLQRGSSLGLHYDSASTTLLLAIKERKTTFYRIK
ncbi:MAG: ankyrin repeat domain-containing protein [Verrucomicrobia bacterium]|nr:ankyrin repeat domain-containing protein [Verrucomicrobiota bacterium]